MNDQQYDNALHMMEVLGGSFVKSLAHCYLMADSENAKKLKKAFKQYFHEYEVQFGRWKLNRPKPHCAGHERYASDCGACYHINANRSIGS
jgi:hypothetical protein